MPSYTLNYCNNSIDYTRMFEVPCGSCMVMQPDGSSHALWRKIKAEQDLYPSAWYHYTPHSMGVWLTKNGKPIARAMLYRDDITKDIWPEFGDVKYVSVDKGRLLAGMLVEEGKEYLSGYVLAVTFEPFDVPGIVSGVKAEGVVCPLPHCDAQAKDFSVTYNADTQVFTFWPDAMAPKDAYKVTLTYNHDGFLRASEVMENKQRVNSYAELWK